MEYLVMIWVYNPYKIELERRVKASSQIVAMKKVLKEFKELPKIKGKHINEFSYKVIKLGKVVIQ